jgi:hypothetical protein
MVADVLTGKQTPHDALTSASAATDVAPVAWRLLPGYAPSMR